MLFYRLNKTDEYRSKRRFVANCALPAFFYVIGNYGLKQRKLEMEE